MQRKTLLIGGLATAALLGALAWAFAPQPVAVEVAPATLGPFEITIDEDGKTRLRDRYIVSAPLAGRLARISLRAGDPVAVGDVVASLTPSLSPLLDERTLREQGSRVDAARAQLGAADAAIAQAQVAVSQARLALRRSEPLARQGFVSPTQVDNDRLALQATERAVDAARQQRDVALHGLEQARAALQMVRQGGSAAFAVRAPVAGQVLRVLQASEGSVPAGAALLELGDVRRIEVVAELLTTDALRAAPGAPVRIERWGGPGSLTGKVRLVEPAAFTKVSALGVEEQRVNVLIDLTSPPDAWRNLGDGYRVGVRVVVLAREQALQVPVSAVFPRAEAAGEAAGAGPSSPSPGMAVFRLEGGRARLTPVTVGGRNGSRAWITEGLGNGAQVIVYPGATVTDGARVKPRKV